MAEKYPNITKLTLSEGLEEIGDNAFIGMESISGDVVIPNSVSSIGEMAFADGVKLVDTWEETGSVKCINTSSENIDFFTEFSDTSKYELPETWYAYIFVTEKNSLEYRIYRYESLGGGRYGWTKSPLSGEGRRRQPLISGEVSIYANEIFIIQNCPHKNNSTQTPIKKINNGIKLININPNTVIKPNAFKNCGNLYVKYNGPKEDLTKDEQFLTWGLTYGQAIKCTNGNINIAVDRTTPTTASDINDSGKLTYFCSDKPIELPTEEELKKYLEETQPPEVQPAETKPVEEKPVEVPVKKTKAKSVKK